ncbi:hypothetical protein AB0M44_04835 [Streptosporangium subroseum]|uniref:hypothetical protein n=1 Tax=Streptosporangium subroseum TaxID=106412 RepID=UPI00343A2C92
MNHDLEGRLREALDERAQVFEASPQAWPKVQARARRARLRRWTALTLLPALAAACAVALVVVMPGGGGPDISASPTKVDDPIAELSAENPPVGEILSIPRPDFAGSTINIWFSGSTRDHERLCTESQVTPTGGRAAFCQSMDPWKEKQFARYAGGTDTAMPAPQERLAYGAARPEVAAVTATTDDGQSFPGALHREGGRPWPIWTVPFPGDAPVTAFVFTDEAGRVLQRLPRTIPWDCDGDRAPVGTGIQLPGGVSAHLHAENCLVFWHHGEQAGTDFGGVAARGEPLSVRMTKQKKPAVIWGGPGQSATGGLWYGYTGEETHRVELRLNDGRQTSAQTVRDPWGQGVRFFGGTIPKGGDPNLDGAVYLGYDAGGGELWREVVPGGKHPSRPPTPR